jgi:opacity protein-like surface antigen
MLTYAYAGSRRPRLSDILGVLAVASLTSASLAQSSDNSPDLVDTRAIEDYPLYPINQARDDDSRRARFVFSAGGEYQFDSSIDTAGDFSVFRANTGLGVSVPIADQLSVAFGTSFGYARYDFDSAAVFGGEEPWEHIFTGQVTAIADYAMDDTWSMFGGGIVGMSGEDGADFGDSITGGGLIGAGYRHSDKLSFRLGASVMSQIEDDAVLMPVILVDWRLDEHWRLRLGSLDTASGDLVGAGLSYAMTEQLSVGGRLSWTRQRFRLDDSGFAPSGVGQDDRFKGSLVINWRATDHIDLGLLGGMAFGGELRIEDENGDRLFKEDYDPAAFVGARLTWRF